jgi:hypothetical protein
MHGASSAHQGLYIYKGKPGHQEAMSYIASYSLVRSDGDSFALGYKS